MYKRQEAIKTGVLSGETLFSLFEDGTLTDAPAEVIARCIRYKAGVVERDEKEQDELSLIHICPVLRKHISCRLRTNR